MKTKLQEIVAGMRRAVEQRPVEQRPVCWTEFTLGGGLRLILSKNDERYVLSLRREGVFPSEHEIAVLVREFGLPEGTEPRRRQLTENRGRSIRWCIVDLAWTELPAAGTATFGQGGRWVTAG